ncbi:hypothetical protein Q4E93_21940 [Flavitalea sp. BT771]|uniref:hypothetical protein n=1 Tax=Flavitalea sp. BT771 TaxID=3063329 RepID=UPI0026E16015|nr:hypothetical protein [Flavitalea sp. BT771]MDO6433288.1 hypothetical protein [Flavitalea sp. BT771]MDV6222807.1 hypothetical protein [Flavitalea sp. BT771]
MLEQISTQTFAKAILVLMGFFYGYVLLLFRKEIAEMLKRKRRINSNQDNREPP